MLPCRRFADTLAGACARLGADADLYSFIVVDLHHPLLAGLPAHLLKNSISLGDREILAFTPGDARINVGDHGKLSQSACRASCGVYEGDLHGIWDCIDI